MRKTQDLKSTTDLSVLAFLVSYTAFQFSHITSRCTLLLEKNNNQRIKNEHFGDPPPSFCFWLYSIIIFFPITI